jgi:predicted RND superfamily exporter protein
VIDQQLGGTVTLDIILDRKSEDKAAVEDGHNIDGGNEFSSDEFGGDAFAVDPFSQQDSPSDNISEQDEFGGGAFNINENDIFDDVVNSAKGRLQSAVQGSNYWFTRGGLDQIEAVHDYLESLPEVGKVQSLATVYKVGRDLNGRTLNDFELALVRSALPEDIEDFLVKPYLASDREQTRITLRVKETDKNLRRNELLKKIESHLVNDLGFDDEQVNLTGVLVLYNNMLQSLFRSQIVTIGAVFFGILFMFMVLFRSLSLSLIALIPNMLAALVVLGGMGLTGIPLDMMTITIAAIAVGIGVDDAIHYICRFRREFSIEKNYLKSMHNTHASIGRAMYYTSATIIGGFSVLVLSQFIPSIYFGLLTGLAMFVAILSSLTLLPKLLLIFKPLGKENIN